MTHSIVVCTDTKFIIDERVSLMFGLGLSAPLQGKVSVSVAVQRRLAIKIEGRAYIIPVGAQSSCHVAFRFDIATRQEA
jgi:hypothetical protein